MNTLQVLIEARALIADPNNWFGGGNYNASSPFRLCALSAIGYVEVKNGSISCVRTSGAEDALARVLGRPVSHIPRFNDSHKHSEVLALFDRAIAAERAKSTAAAVKAIMKDALRPDTVLALTH